jgi:hypothetical protein
VTESEKSKAQHAADDHQEQFEPVERPPLQVMLAAASTSLSAMDILNSLSDRPSLPRLPRPTHDHGEMRKWIRVIGATTRARYGSLRAWDDDRS